MRIGIIGTGHIGGTLARLWTRAGHEVALANSRGPQSLSEMVREIGPQARAVTVEEAAAFGEVALLAIPLGKYRSLPARALRGKIVIDAMNYYPQRDGDLALGDLTSSEMVARYLEGSRLVKAFNTMNFQTLATEGDVSKPLDDRLVIFLAGDDREAKEVVARLIEEIGFGPLDTGGLAEGGRKQQPGSPVYTRPMTVAQARAELEKMATGG